MRYVIALFALSLVSAGSSLGQDATVSLVRANAVGHSDWHTFYVELQVAHRIATITSDHHPLRLALFWGTWLEGTSNERRMAESKAERRFHQLGGRLIHSTSSGRVQPLIRVGFLSQFGTDLYGSRRHVQLIEAGPGLSVRVYSHLRLQAHASIYLPLVSENDITPTHYALGLGILVGAI